MESHESKMQRAYKSHKRLQGKVSLEDCIKEIFDNKRWCTNCQAWEDERFFKSYTGKYEGCCFLYRKREYDPDAETALAQKKYNQLIEIKDTAKYYLGAMLAKEWKRAKELWNDLEIKIDDFEAMEVKHLNHIPEGAIDK